MDNTTIIKNDKGISYNFPKVSVVVATYRRKETLEKAIQSLLMQTYSNIEIIVVDDNAHPGWNLKVENIVNNIKLSSNYEIIYIKNRENKGSAKTRNVGIEQATGEYITFLDDDDFYLPNKVKKQVEHMIKENSDFSLTDLWLYDEKDILIEKRIRNYIKDFSTDSLMKYHLMYHMTGTDAMMFKKNYLIEIGMFFPINVGDEFYLMQKAIDGKGIFSYLPRCDIKAYVHSEMDGLSSGDGKIKGENKLYEYKKKFFNRMKLKEIRYIRMRHYAVLAFAELRAKNIMQFFQYAILSFYSSPIQCLKLFIERRK